MNEIKIDSKFKTFIHTAIVFLHNNVNNNVDNSFIPSRRKKYIQWRNESHQRTR